MDRAWIGLGPSLWHTMKPLEICVVGMDQGWIGDGSGMDRPRGKTEKENKQEEENERERERETNKDQEKEREREIDLHQVSGAYCKGTC